VCKKLCEERLLVIYSSGVYHINAWLRSELFRRLASFNARLLLRQNLRFFLFPEKWRLQKICKWSIGIGMEHGYKFLRTLVRVMSGQKMATNLFMYTARIANLTVFRSNILYRLEVFRVQ
jgi:hypothetical protein